MGVAIKIANNEFDCFIYAYLVKEDNINMNNEQSQIEKLTHQSETSGLLKMLLTSVEQMAQEMKQMTQEIRQMAKQMKQMNGKMILNESALRPSTKQPSNVLKQKKEVLS